MMKLKAPTLLLLGTMILYLVSCGKDKPVEPTPTPPTPPPPPVTIPAPVISSFTPVSGNTGTVVTITGTNFTGVTAVSFGGVAATSFVLTSGTTINAVVATGATGEVKVTTPAGSGTKTGFTFSTTAPTFTGISQKIGSIGSTITLTGTNFAGATSVTFGGAAAAFVVIDNTTISATLAEGASGEVKITTPEGMATMAGFTYVPHSLAPAKLPETQLGRGVGIGFPLHASRQKKSGTVRVAVVFVDFSDAPARRTPESVYGLVSPSSENFLRTISYGAMDLVFQPKMKWYRMSKPSTAYSFATGESHRDYIQEAVNLADAEFDFSQSDQLLILTNPDANAFASGPTFTGTSSYGITADSKHFANAITSGRDILYWANVGGLWFPHEFGHSMGLADLYAYTGANGLRYTGTFSLMGDCAALAPDFTAWEKWLLGWITDSQVRAVNVAGTGTVQLTPLGLKGGLKLVVIPLDANTAVCIEDRRAIGVDGKLPKEGPLVYVVDSKLASGYGVLKVLPVSDTDEVKGQATLSVGQSVTYGKVTVKCVSSGAGGSTLAYEVK